jgi:hypothetical protein
MITPTIQLVLSSSPRTVNGSNNLTPKILTVGKNNEGGIRDGSVIIPQGRMKPAAKWKKTPSIILPISCYIRHLFANINDLNFLKPKILSVGKNDYGEIPGSVPGNSRYEGGSEPC